MSTLRTERVKPVRASRAASRRRRRILLLAVGLPVLLVALALGVWWLSAEGGLFGGGPGDQQPLGDQRITVLAYRGEQTGIAVLATSRSGISDDVVLAVPTNVIASTPGHGTGPLGEALAGGSRVAGTTVANLLGVPVTVSGVLSPAALAEIGDELGGFDVDLGTQVTIAGRTVGPGPVSLSGEEVAFYLDGTEDALEAGLRFQEVLPGLIAAAGRAPEALQAAVSDGDEGFAAEVARVDPETLIEELPVRDAGSGVASLDTAAAADLVAELFDTPTDQVASVVLLNGNGIPGIGAEVGERIVPAGFQVVVSTNAVSFDFQRTEIVVRSEGLLDEGRRLRSLLGVGQVSVVEASTGLADITVLIGRDYSGA